MLADVSATPASAAKAAVGPGAFPAIIGFGLVAVGVRLLYETREVLPGLWAPCREEIFITATAAMILPFRRELRFEFSSYRPEPRADAVPRRHAAREGVWSTLYTLLASRV